jgi:TetR/AcrR family transcriptional regulator, transcriptional repressor of bet genes
MTLSKTRRPTRTSDDRRGDIARAAVKILQTEGYAALTARKVAAEADISLGHISYHFHGMDEVLAEAYRLASGRLRAATEVGLDLSAKVPLVQVNAFLWAGFSKEFLQPEHLRMRIDLWSAALAHPEIAAAERALYQRYREELERLLSAVAGDDPARQARVAQVSDTVMATLDGLWLDWMRRRDASAVENGLNTCMLIVQQLLG